MSKESSVAPTERVNIVYKPATGNAQEQVELPLKILMMGDFTGQADDTPLEQRAPINVDKGNFNEVMAQQNLKVTLTAADKLCAYLKCLEKRGAGNPEFAKAEKALRASIDALALPEVRYFLVTFVPSFRLTLDELE